jgi:hypothetical protein
MADEELPTIEVQLRAIYKIATDPKTDPKARIKAHQLFEKLKKQNAKKGTK